MQMQVDLAMTYMNMLVLLLEFMILCHFDFSYLKTHTFIKQSELHFLVGQVHWEI